MVSTGISIFSAPFFLRNHFGEVESLAQSVGEILGLQLAPIGFLGLSLGIAFGLAGAVGTWLGGVLSDVMGKTDVRRTIWPAVGGGLLAFLLYKSALMAPSTIPSLVLFTCAQIAIAMTVGPFFATVQAVTPRPFRATSSAISLLIINLVGSLGPLLIGIGSDVAASNFGSGGGLRIAMAGAIMAIIVSAGLFAASQRTIAADLEI